MLQPDQPTEPGPAVWTGVWPRLAVLGAVVALAAVIFALYRDRLDLHALAARETQLRTWYEAHPLAALAIAFVAYAVVTGLSIPGGVVMSVLYGWLFGFWRALIVVSFASTTGATIAMLLCRYLLGHWIQTRFGPLLEPLNRRIEREGAFYLFTLRLIPQVPFFVVNAGMGLTKLPVRTFWWVSQLGMLPGTCVFILAGLGAPSLQEVADRGLASLLDWRLMTALVLLGVLPLLLKWALGGVRQRAERATIE
jgi:uncharacterized membrane protein YdjX (TVP38/TMEM64 family)